MATVQSLCRVSRLVTLTGAGGIGKTRLALQCGRLIESEFADGAFLVDLSPVSIPGVVPKTVASALGVLEQPGREMLQTLTERLRHCEMLLILDNCEHLTQACAELVYTLLSTCPGLHVLATSREPLGVPGERLFRVAPLGLPDPGQKLTLERVQQAESVQLLVERACASEPSFRLTLQNAPAFVSLCRQLDGIPLAIELAAARLSLLSAEQLCARMGEQFELLTGGNRTAQPRQQTMYGTLNWSHDLLSTGERMLLRRLAVFAGDWTLEAAEAVCSGDDLEPAEVLDLLAGLLNKSLVVVASRDHREGVRYRLLEPVRQYSREKLLAAGEEIRMRERHCDWFVAVAEKAAHFLLTREQVLWLDHLEREQANLRAALLSASARSDGSVTLGRLVRALGLFWYLHAHLSEGRPWLEAAIATIAPPDVRAGALLSLAWQAFGLGELEHATELVERSLASARDCDDRQTTVVALLVLSFTLRDRDCHARSVPLLDDSLALARQIGHRWAEAFSLFLMDQEARHRGDPETGECCLALALPIFRDLGERLGLAYTLRNLSRHAFERADFERARDLALESLQASRELGNRRGICFALNRLADEARRKRDYRQARRLIGETVAIWEELGNRPSMAVGLTALGSLMLACGEPGRAVRLFGAAETMLDEAGAARSWGGGQQQLEIGYERTVMRLREMLGEDAFQTGWAAGRALGPDQLAQLIRAAAGDDPSGAASARLGPFAGAATRLSSRQQEIAALLARGYTNAEIASELIITRRTVDTHVAHIFARLGVHTRAQVAAWVAERRGPQSTAISPSRDTYVDPSFTR